MVSHRQIKLVGLAALSTILVFVLYRSNTNHRVKNSPAILETDADNFQQLTLITSNLLIDSNNDDKVDAAINHKISKLGQGGSDEEVEKDTLESSSKGKDKQDDSIAALLDKEIDLILSDKDDGKDDDHLSKYENADFNPIKELHEIRKLSPMVIFSKTYCPFSKKLKVLLQGNYQITPQPTIVELDKHSHGSELQDYLFELTGRKTVPNVLVGSKSTESRGGADDFIRLHEEGTLLDLLKEWGGKELDVKKAEAPSNL